MGTVHWQFRGNLQGLIGVVEKKIRSRSIRSSSAGASSHFRSRQTPGADDDACRAAAGGGGPKGRDDVPEPLRNAPRGFRARPRPKCHRRGRMRCSGPGDEDESSSEFRNSGLKRRTCTRPDWFPAHGNLALPSHPSLQPLAELPLACVRAAAVHHPVQSAPRLPDETRRLLWPAAADQSRVLYM